ncbi:GTPase-activating protein GYP3 [Diutina catenulata]
MEGEQCLRPTDTSPVKGHHRTESSYSRNVSVLEMYVPGSPGDSHMTLPSPSPSTPSGLVEDALGMTIPGLSPTPSSGPSPSKLKNLVNEELVMPTSQMTPSARDSDDSKARGSPPITRRNSHGKKTASSDPANLANESESPDPKIPERSAMRSLPQSGSRTHLAGNADKETPLNHENRPKLTLNGSRASSTANITTSSSTSGKQLFSAYKANTDSPSGGSAASISSASMAKASNTPFKFSTPTTSHFSILTATTPPASRLDTPPSTSANTTAPLPESPASFSGEDIMKGLDDLDFKRLEADDTVFGGTALGAESGPDPEPMINETNLEPSPPPEVNIEAVVDDASLKKVLAQPFDIYGFRKQSSVSKITRAEYDKWYTEYGPYMMRRRQKWDHLLKQHGLGSSSMNGSGSRSSTGSRPSATGPMEIPSRFPPKSDKVKKLIRRGIPPEWRGSAWFFYAGGYEKLNKHRGVYDTIVADTAKVHNKDTEVIDRDLHRTFPDNIYFNANLDRVSGETAPPPNNPSSSTTSLAADTPMIHALRRVLVAFAHYQPHIGYCQSLNFLAGLLLLFMPEERAFWMLVILTERIIPKVHAATLEGVHTDQGVLMLCIKEYIPSLWAILGRGPDGEMLSDDKMLARMPPVTLVTSSWFMSVFVGILPVETALRVWDILWYEGSKTIFRISLTVCNMCLEQDKFKRPKGDGAEVEQIELFQFMQNYPKTILDPNQLVDLCFKKIGGYGFGRLSQDEINNCREFVSKQREKLSHSRKARGLLSEMTAAERQSLLGSDDIHDVYGFNRSIMSGVVWNKSISNRMKKKFSMKSK